MEETGIIQGGEDDEGCGDVGRRVTQGFFSIFLV